MMSKSLLESFDDKVLRFRSKFNKIDISQRSMSYNNYVKIVSKHISKNSDVVIIIPSFKSAQLTTDTIVKINELNSNINFDIIIVDNEGHDYNEIKKFFPEINCIILENNIGGAGSQYIALKIAVEYGYKYYCLSDNDAVPVDQGLFWSQIEYLDTHSDCGAVLPFREGRQKGRVNNTEFHFFMIRHSMIEKIGLPNPDYFLVFDDIDYSTRVCQTGSYIFRLDKRYYHPYTKTSSLLNPSIYFRTRSLLIFLFNKGIFLRYKYKYILYFFQYVGFHMFHAITLWDASIIRTIIRAVVDFIRPNLTLEHPSNRFVFKLIDENIGLPDFNLEKNRLFLYYGKKFVNTDKGCNSCFQIIIK